MTINEYDIVALTENVLANHPEIKQPILLRRGQVGTVLLIDSFIQVIESLTPEENKLLRTKLHARTIQKTPGVCGGQAHIDNTRILIWTLVSPALLP